MRKVFIILFCAIGAMPLIAQSIDQEVVDGCEFLCMGRFDNAYTSFSKGARFGSVTAQYYLAYCQDEGIEPDKSYTGVLNVRLTPAIHRQIAMLALQAGLSINAYIKDALEEKVEMVMAG